MSKQRTGASVNGNVQLAQESFALLQEVQQEAAGLLEDVSRPEPVRRPRSALQEARYNPFEDRDVIGMGSSLTVFRRGPQKQRRDTPEDDYDIQTAPVLVHSPFQDIRVHCNKRICWEIL